MKIYRAFAYLIAAEVLLQAAFLALGMFRFGSWISDGGVATKDTVTEGASFPGSTAFSLHGENGALWIPLLALTLVAVAVATRRSVTGGLRWAAIVLGLVLLQVALGFASLAMPNLGALHALNAFALLAAAVHAGRRAAGAEPESLDQHTADPAAVR